MLQAALNGDRTRDEHPAVPLSAAELARDAAACVAAGAGAIHLHPRDAEGRESAAPEVVNGVVEAVKAACGVPVGVTTGAWIEPDLERRLAAIAGHLYELLDEHDPDALAIEEVFFGRNARSAFAVGQARGVVMLAAGQGNVPCASYTPQQVKGAVCGNGRAAKDQVQRMVQALLTLPDLPKPDHAADALAIAICHTNGAPLAAALSA